MAAVGGPPGWQIVAASPLGGVLEDLIGHLASIDLDGTPPLEVIADWIDIRRGVESVPAVNGVAKSNLAHCPSFLLACNSVVEYMCGRVGAAAVSLRQTLQWGPAGEPNPYQLIREWARSADGSAGSAVRAAKAQRASAVANRGGVKPRAPAGPRALPGRGGPARGQPKPPSKPQGKRASVKRASVTSPAAADQKKKEAFDDPPALIPARVQRMAALAQAGPSDTIREIRALMTEQSLRSSGAEAVALLALAERDDPSPASSPESKATRIGSRVVEGRAKEQAEILPDELQKMLGELDKLREQVRELAEKGSPTDEDLSQMDLRAKEYDGLKDQAADLLSNRLASDPKDKVELKDPDAAVECLVKVLGEGDEREGSTELVHALLKHVDAPFADAVDKQGLVAVQCGDGNTKFLSTLLEQLPSSCYDAPEVLASACFSQTKRIPLVSRVIESVDLAPFADECKDLLQEFFEDIASHQRAILKEDRQGRPELLLALLSLPEQLRPVVGSEPGDDGMTVFARCAADGDLLLLDILRRHAPEALSPTEALEDGTTPLQHSILRGHLPMLKELLSMPGCEVDKHTDAGTALGLAEALGKTGAIQALKAKGAKLSVPPKVD
eukprot:Hpha_TRINITY_DN1253_c0_g1::TRINITY_DN1253_c0_g1_i1::g.44899::m.44899